MPPAQKVSDFFGYNTGWRVELHPRFAVDITRDGRADLIGFADDGVWISLAQTDGTYSVPMLVLAQFGRNYGWQVDKHPRFLADTNANGLLDIVGFADDGIRTSQQLQFSEFSPLVTSYPEWGYNAGWRVDKHPRFVVDINADGRADIVGFGDDAVYISLANSDGSFAAPTSHLQEFSYNAGWRINKNPVFLADTTGDRRLDVIGFADDGIRLSRQRADGTFPPPVKFLPEFCYNAGWRVEKNPRFVADITGDGRADIIGFGNNGVTISLAQADGTYAAPQFVVGQFGYDQGWRIEKHPRFLADTTGDRLLDIVGIADDGVYVSRNLGGGKFDTPALLLQDFGINKGWLVEKHPRFMADIDASGKASVVGFGEAGVWVARLV